MLSKCSAKQYNDLQELEKLEKLAAKPLLEEELKEKFQATSWDADGFPTADKDGAPLSEKVRLLIAIVIAIIKCR